MLVYTMRMGRPQPIDNIFKLIFSVNFQGISFWWELSIQAGCGLWFVSAGGGRSGCRQGELWLLVSAG